MSFAAVFRSPSLQECEQRAFLLYAVGVHSEIVRDGETYLLVVPQELHGVAVDELQRHDAEARAVAPPPPKLRLHGHAWLGAIGYALIMMFVAWAAGERLFGADWYARGALESATFETGEWFRFATALTLHGDVAHLFANLAFGVIFGYFAGQMLGPGVAWLSVLAGAVFGNVLDVLLMPAGASSIGASTAVFATLGLVAAHAWKITTNARMRWAYRYAPLVAGVALLGFTGAGGENTDVVAHATGFLSGACIGALHAWNPSSRLFDRRLQAACGAIALLIVGGAWTAALAS